MHNTQGIEIIVTEQQLQTYAWSPLQTCKRKSLQETGIGLLCKSCAF
jgi:hypothetical protein